MLPSSATDLETARKARLAEKRQLQTSSRRAHDLLRSSIRMGLMARNTALMEHKLVSGLSTSRNAIREALQLLAEEGLVERSPRTGTWLIGSILEVPMDQFLPLVHRSKDQQDRVTVKHLESRVVPATPVLSAKLDVEPGEPLNMSEQLILVDDQPVAVRCCYVIDAFVQERVSAQWPDGYSPTDLSTTLSRMFGIVAETGTVENILEAMACEPRTSERLGVKVGTPILSRELLIRNSEGTPYLFGYARYRGDRIAIGATVPISRTA
ncbi:MAG: putative GntR-family transcriptional regulator [Pseudonocardiales bacterium]|nr:putative GntR-family transcriptional regulator [Pseudonocardiales bacterium]